MPVISGIQRNSRYTLERSFQLYATQAYGNGPAQVFDRGSIIIVDDDFPVTDGMRFLDMTIQSPSVQASTLPGLPRVFAIGLGRIGIDFIGGP